MITSECVTSERVRPTAVSFDAARSIAAQSAARSELALVKAVRAGEPGAARRFLDAVSATLWSIVVKLEGEGGEAAFFAVIDALKADNFARLAGFEGRSRLATYLAITARDILAEELAQSFVEAPQRAWTRFERFFGAELRRRIARRFPYAIGKREDAYQEVCLGLIENDYRRIRAYQGHGNFAGYILTVVERILIDLVRRDSPRRRLPAAIARLPRLEQEVYAAVVWERAPLDAGRLAAALRGRGAGDPGSREIRLAVERVARVSGLAAASGPRAVSIDAAGWEELADPGAGPEEHLLWVEEEAARAALLAAVKTAAEGLPADERLYLQIVFTASEPLPARTIARAMQLPVTEVYRLKQRAQRWLAQMAAQAGYGLKRKKIDACPSMRAEGRKSRPMPMEEDHVLSLAALGRAGRGHCSLRIDG